MFQNFVPVAKIQGDKHYSIISDHLGTPILATDEQGNKVWERTLDIYGRVRKEECEKDFCNMLSQLINGYKKLGLSSEFQIDDTNK